jgi:hypothetical protein
MFTFQCVHCRKEIEANEEVIGTEQNCIFCHEKIIIPGTGKKEPVVVIELTEKGKLRESTSYNFIRGIVCLLGFFGIMTGLVIIAAVTEVTGDSNRAFMAKMFLVLYGSITIIGSVFITKFFNMIVDAVDALISINKKLDK